MNAVLKYPGAKWSLAGWHRETITATDQLSRRRQEILWMNFEPEQRQERMF